VVLDSRSGALFHSFPGPVDMLTLDEATDRLFSVPGDASALLVIDARSGRILHRSPICSAVAPALVIGAARLFVPCADGTISLFDARSGRPAGNFTTSLGACECPIIPDPVTGRLFWPAGAGLAVLDARRATLLGTLPVQVWTGGAFKMFPHPIDVEPGTGDVLVAPFTPAGTGTPAQAVLALDGKTGAVKHRWPVDPNPLSVLINPLTGHVLVTSAGPVDLLGQPLGNGILTVLDPATGATLKRIDVGITPGGLTIDVHSQRLFVCNYTTDLDGNMLYRRPLESWWARAQRRLKQAMGWLPFSAPPPAVPGHASVTVLDAAQL
jgi:DNA-binding beta-propeller fold protein YncE